METFSTGETSGSSSVYQYTVAPAWLQKNLYIYSKLWKVGLQGVQ